MSNALAPLLTRRSVKAKDMVPPGPSDAELTEILRAGVRVPDHGKLGPWRLLRFAGESRTAFGQVLAARYRELHPEASDALVALEADRFLRAPVVVAVISTVRPGIKIPEWEQILSAGAVCQNLLTAATLSGFASQWLTEWYAYDEVVDRALNLGEHERVAGYVYFGSRTDTPPERPRPTLEERLSDWTA